MKNDVYGCLKGLMELERDNYSFEGISKYLADKVSTNEFPKYLYDLFINGDDVVQSKVWNKINNE